MYSEALVSGPWQEEELLLLDVLAFLLSSSKFRRSKNIKPWKNRSLDALTQLRTTLFQLLHAWSYCPQHLASEGKQCFCESSSVETDVRATKEAGTGYGRIRLHDSCPVANSLENKISTSLALPAVDNSLSESLNCIAGLPTMETEKTLGGNCLFTRFGTS